MSKIGEFLGNAFWVVLYISFIYGELFGIAHSVRKHSLPDTVASVSLPPWAWWRSIELFWHDDFADVDWDKRLASDMLSCVYFVTMSNDQSSNKYELNEDIEEFSKKIREYPTDKKKFLVDGTRKYIQYGQSITTDFIAAVRASAKSNKFDLIFSENTTKLENELRNYKLDDDITVARKGLDELGRRLEKRFEPDPVKRIDHEIIENMITDMELRAETQVNAYKKVFKGIFDEEY